MSMSTNTEERKASQSSDVWNGAVSSEAVSAGGLGRLVVECDVSGAGRRE